MKENIMGISVNTEGYDALIKDMFERIERNQKSMIVAINPEKIVKAKEDKSLFDLLNRAEYQIPDGIGVILASKLRKGNIKERVTGIDMMVRLCEEASKKGKSIFLYGAKPGIADEAKAELLRKYPSLNIAGTMDGYEKDEEKVINAINAAKPDILFVAMGSPRQENWIEKNRERLHPTIYQGVGGSFDVLAGKIERAPEFIQKAGLEWFYRLLKEPSRIKRQLVLPVFLLAALRNKN